jgi:hypothetical protein
MPKGESITMEEIWVWGEHRERVIRKSVPEKNTFRDLRNH